MRSMRRITIVFYRDVHNKKRPSSGWIYLYSVVYGRLSMIKYDHNTAYIIPAKIFAKTYYP